MPARILVQGVVHVQVLRGEGLADRDTFTKQDPYVKLFLYDGGRRVRAGERVLPGWGVCVEGGG
jgi:hypothetical protein